VYTTTKIAYCAWHRKRQTGLNQKSWERRRASKYICLYSNTMRARGNEILKNVEKEEHRIYGVTVLR
jgi:hypothetical protein